MFRFKYLLVVLLAAMLAGVVFVACNDDDDKVDAKAEGLKAGKEICDCMAANNTTNKYLNLNIIIKLKFIIIKRINN